MNNTLWQTKLLARIHDPAEKALVLMRDRAGHEGGTSRVLRRLLSYTAVTEQDLAYDPDNTEALAATVFKDKIPLTGYKHVKRADWWAAAADRPQWPLKDLEVNDKKNGGKKIIKAADFSVSFTEQPVLKHPLTGAELNLENLQDTDITDIKQRSFEHFAKYTCRNADASTDFYKTLLAYWRFGPEVDEENDNGTIGALWRLLPADTRVPDHSIWDHLDITSAFAGAFAADENQEAALLSLSIGPVQSFIEAARTTSDLWAGSHLLSRLAWEAMKPVCAEYGPDAILFPRLRGVPQVDIWLRDECKLDKKWFENSEWTEKNSDANPLFSAALPNRFVAVLPANKAAEVAKKVEIAVRQYLQDLGKEVVDRLLKTANLEGEYAYQQMQQQLSGFPEVHWAVVPFSLIHARNAEKQSDLDTSQLSTAMAPFFGVSESTPAGFLATDAWKNLLKTPLDWGDSTTFFAPNPGVLYPAVYDLAERVMAASKAARTFAPSTQQGWRCSLTGESEWLTTDLAQLQIPAGKRKDTLWAKIAKAKPAWAKKGEHLGGLAAIKRLWPTLFAEEVAESLGQGKDSASRFVVSTHTMALTTTLAEWVKSNSALPNELCKAVEAFDTVALPKKLVRLAQDARFGQSKTLARIPAWLDAFKENEDDTGLEKAQKLLKDCFDTKTETYYALLLMDGDSMGKWLSGEYAIPYRDCFHPKVQNSFDKVAAYQESIQRYGKQPRALAPNRHLAISGALNDFSLNVARHVVEHEHLGRLLYAGGDDVMAMLPTSDLLSCMVRLNCAYQGHDPTSPSDWGKAKAAKDKILLKNGFGILNNKLMRLMGEKATASIGAVIAHHQAPLSAVLRELRAAEKRAKRDVKDGGGGRNAFSISIVKRSGGTLVFTAQWGDTMQLFEQLLHYLRDEGVSRRVVYHILEWLKDLEAQPNPEMLQSLLAYQLDRQADKAAKEHHNLLNLAENLAKHTKDQGDKGKAWLENLLGVAEFLARETRTGASA